MIYIMGKWPHVRDLCKRLGLKRRQDFLHFTRPEQLTEGASVVVLDYDGRDLRRMFQAITARKCKTYGEHELTEGTVPK